MPLRKWRHGEWAVAIPIGVIVVLVAGLLALCVDVGYAADIPQGTATVIDKSFTPSSTSTGIGTNGKTTVVTVHRKSAAWCLVVRLNGEIVPAYTSPDGWAKFKSGDRVSLTQRVGWWFRGNHRVMEALP